MKIYKNLILSFLLLNLTTNLSYAQAQVENNTAAPEIIRTPASILESIIDVAPNPNATTTPEQAVVENEIDMQTHPIADKLSKKMPSIGRIEVQGVIGREKQSVGSGSLITTDGLILTNYHVITGHLFNPKNTQLTVTFPNKDPIKANLKIVDIVNDLALIQLEEIPADLELIELNPKIPQAGEQVYSAGYPHGWSLTLLEGLFNNLTTNEFSPQYILSNALSAGMSGGPTFDTSGKMIAINVAATNKLSLVIPAKSATSLIEKYEQTLKNKTFKNYSENIQAIRNLAIENYSEVVSKIIDAITKSENLKIGSFNLPIKNSLFECWSAENDRENSSLERIPSLNKERVLIAQRICKTPNEFFLNEEKEIGKIGVLTYYYDNKNSTKTLYDLMIQKKYNGFISSFQDGKCFQENLTNSSKTLQNMAFCVSPIKATKQLFDFSTIGLYKNGTEYVFVIKTFSAISQENIKTIIKYVKTI